MNKFISIIEGNLSMFKETGDINYLLTLESVISEFLDYTVEDYLEETNYINETTSFSIDYDFYFDSSDTL